MQFTVHGKNIEVTEAISSHVEARLGAALDQHQARVRDVTVRLEDVNGPKGGRDMRCHVVIALKRGGTLVVEELHEDLYAAVSLAADCAKQVVSREIARRRSR